MTKYNSRGCVALATKLLLTGVFAGCATAPLDEVVRVQEELATAKTDVFLAQYAPVELYEAEKTLDRAEQTWQRDQDREEAVHLAELAEVRIAIARQVADKRIAEDSARALSLEREKVLMQARTREVDVARTQAELALKRAKEEARRAEQEAQLAREAQARAEQEAQRAREAQARAGELERTLEELKAERTDRGIVLTLGDVLFDFDRAELRPGAKQNLARLVTFLQENTDREVIIEGHTDAIGSDSYNLDLSRRRATAVRTFLIESGIGTARLVAEGYGKGYPVTTNETAVGRQQNRRVEVVILDPGERAVERVRQQAVGAGKR